MIRYAFDLYPRADPVAGARILRFSELQAAEYRGEANGTGSGRAILRGSTSDADAIDPAGLQYSRVRRINEAVVDGATLSGFSEAVVGGFFFDKGEFEALTEKSTKKLNFAGAGTLSYLGRVVAADEPYLTSIATSTKWKVAATGTPPAGWHDVGFDDSGYADAVAVSDNRWVNGCSARWIWQDAGPNQGSGEERSFRKEFTLPYVPASMQLLVGADNGCLVYLNGTLVASIDAVDRGAKDVAPFAFMAISTVGIDVSLLSTGLNCISIIGWNETTPLAGPAGVYASLIDPDLPGPVDGEWTFPDEPAGAILWRLLSEALTTNRPQQPIPGVTLTFSRTLDSAGNPWNGVGSISAQVGENLLSSIRRLMEAGLYISINPDTFAVSAWPIAGHGRSRTGGAWGTNVVRFQAPTDGTIATGNIKSEAKRGIAALIQRSDLLVGGGDIYKWVSDDSADLVWEGGYQVIDPDCSSLEEIGNAQLAARADAGDTVRLRIMIGTSPASGKYLPFETAGILLDDTVTLHNGTGQWDWDETEQKVAAISLKLRDGSDWDAWVDLGSQFSSIEDRTFQVSPVGAHTHPPNPPLCNPSSIFIETLATWKILDITGDPEPDGWKEVGFDDSAWAVPIESTEIGALTGLHSIRGHLDFIPSDVAIARKEFTVAPIDLTGLDVLFKYAFDNAGEVWINGVSVAALTGTGSTNYTSNHATTLPRSTFVEGLNCVAIRIENQPEGSIGNTPPGAYFGVTYIEMPVDGASLTGNDTSAARCDHGHIHNDLLGRSALSTHPASAIAFTPGGSIEATNVQDAIDELAAEASTDAELNIEGGQDVIKAHGNMGSVETIDPTDGNVHTGTLNADCTITLNAPAGSGAATLQLWITQDGTGGWDITWPGSVTFDSGTPTPDTAAGVTVRYLLETIDGGTTWIANLIGSIPALTVKDEGTPLATAAESIDFVGDGVVASGTGADKTVTISGAPTGAAGGDLSGTYPNPSVVDDSHAHTDATAPGGPAHVHVAQEQHTSDGATTTFTTDQVYEPGSVMCHNLTTGHRVGINTETLPDQITLAAAGTAGDVLAFDYAASVT